MNIDNINMIQSSLDASELKHMFLHLGRIFMTYYPRNAYILSINRLAAIGKNIDEVRQKGLKIAAEIEKLSSDINSIIPIPVESCSAAIAYSKDESEFDSLVEKVSQKALTKKNDNVKVVVAGVAAAAVIAVGIKLMLNKKKK